MDVEPTRTAMAPAAPALVQVQNLEKRYPKQQVNAVDGVSFEVIRGEIFGLLGPNGAGKTTTIGILTTRVKPTGGKAYIDDIDVAAEPMKARRLIAVVPQRVNLDRSLTARQNLTFHAAYHGVSTSDRDERADQLLAEFGLGDRGSDKVDRYSGGQAQRLMIARALMHQPEVLFLDEPSTGLDPQARLFVWDRIKELRSRGVTIVLTTHDMDEAAQLADRVGIMDHGKLLALDTPDALTRGLSGRTTLDVTITPSPTESQANLLTACEQLSGVDRVEPVAMESAVSSASDAAVPDQMSRPEEQGPAGTEQIRLRLYLTGQAASVIGDVAQLVASRGGQLADIRVGMPSLEDVFIHLTGRGLR